MVIGSNRPQFIPSFIVYAKIQRKKYYCKIWWSCNGSDKLSSSFAKDIVLLKQVGINPVVIHGGGPRIKKMLERLKVKARLLMV